MKTSARFLAMLLAVIMIAGAALSVSAFSDVTAGTDHATAISVLNQLGVIGGYEDGTFKPDQNVTRAEMAKLVYVLYTTFVDAGAGTVKFDDVKSDNWAVGYISWCASKNIIGGYGDGKFGPSDNVTYDQALKMVAGALGYNEWDPAQWPVDVRMKALNELNLGENIDKSVKGSDKLTRGQVAQIMYNALKAPMKETKTVNQKVPGYDNFYMPIVENKTLIADVWNFTEDTYKIVGTESYGSATKDEDKIAIQKVVDGALKGDVETFKLADLGLEAYSAKTDNLINLYITTVTKDKEMLASASVNGSVTDNVALEYDKTRTFIKINGVKFGPENFNDKEGKNQIRLYTADGKEVADFEYFNEDDKLTADFTNLFDKKAHLARVIDFDGDGNADALVIVEKVAYEVTGSTTKNGIKSWNYKALDGSATGSTPVADITAELAKGDIFVAAKMGNTLYAEVVKPVETYATKLSTASGKVTLNEGGEVAYKNLTVAGAVAKELDTSILGKDKVQVYYVYNNEIIYTDATGSTITDYNFVVLQDVEKTENEFNEVTMEDDTAYVANLLVVEDGKLVTKKVVLSDESTIAGVVYTAEEMYDKFKAGKNKEDNKRVYTYTLVASYEETKNGYTLVIKENLDEDTIVIEPAGSKITYNSTTGLFTVGSTAKVEVDANSAIYYRYDKPNTASGSFMYLGKYDATALSDKDFEVVTYGESYLAYNETTRKYALLATILEDEIEYEAAAVESYENYGSLILYAPKASEIVPVDGKLYNTYYFMDLETLKNKEGVLDKENEYDKVENAGTEEGHLYGYADGTYVEINKDADADLKSVDYAVITDAFDNKGKTFIYVEGSTKAISLDEKVTIWGLGDKDDNGVYTQLTFAELQEMLQLVADFNESENEKLEEGQKRDDLTVQILILKDFNKLSTAEDKYEVASIIVEIFEADEEGVVYSVNDTIFDNFNA